MNAVLTLVLAFAGIAVGYGFYAKTINKNIIQPDEKKATPAKMFMDGVDFSPANRNVLFGYQFKSIAALGPITGPIVAVQWGWLPALLWVIFGTFFIGWVQDYSSIMLGVREEGQSFGALSYRFISPRARNILLTFIYFYLLLIMAAFGKIVGYDLMTNPAVPLGVLLVIGVGLLAGQMTYKWKMDIIVTSLVTVVLAFVGIWLGTLESVKGLFAAINGSSDTLIFGSVTQAQFIWSLIVLVICYFGATLPIWRWAQPINYVAFWIVFLGILAGTIGLLVWHPAFPADFPAFTNWGGNLCAAADCTGIEKAPLALGPLWPILFVTIACGAISGWHSLVSSSGTARQLENEADALYVGGGAMFLEMFLAVLSLLTAVVGVGVTKGFVGYVGMIAAGKNAGVFAVGLSEMMAKIGVPTSFGLPYGSVFLTLMGLTIMYLVVRFMRVASAEFMGDKVPLFKNTTFGTIVALLLSALLIYTGFWARSWVLFGGANQLMASLALLLASLWLMSNGKKYLWTFIPFIFMFVTTVAALLITAYNVINQVMTTPDLPIDRVIGNWLAGLIAIYLVVAATILAVDALKALMNMRAKQTAKAKS
ncbi:MAG: carbon starvation protein A [Anaerolineales bacterium]|nr:carbon starvation protein A [Anaerolineales bacterium]